MREKYIYALADPDTGHVRYIGQSYDPEQRIYQHLSRPTNDAMAEWFDALKESGKRPDIHIVDVVPEDSAIGRERAIEEIFRRTGLITGHRILNGSNALFERQEPTLIFGQETLIYISCKCGAVVSVEGESVEGAIINLDNPIDDENYIQLCAKCGTVNQFRRQVSRVSWRTWWTASANDFAN